VLFSTDGGRSWAEARLGVDHGRYSFREWTAPFQAEAGRRYELTSLAINEIGETQRFTPRWNPGGYLRNAVETVHVRGI
jgi:sulfite dehydrogenase